MKRRAVEYALQADDDFGWLYDLIAEASGATRALAYVERLRAFCDRLDYASERGMRRDDIRPGLRIIGFERRVTAAFMVEAERVVVLRLFYGGANWEDAF
ncbi:MAG: type II toxin-antitoxin system RelE/ParE family toxin [Methylocystis silviterrae]|uniref:type II toxin-antitoxin system RelE/ParE family toxin n=1 Tax=Methylocystis silviterrae TaxID=2743612 RepID=UPI003C767EB7